MKFKCGSDGLPNHSFEPDSREGDIFRKQWEEKKARLSEWHPVYAWLPVTSNDGYCYWLETVMRKGTYTYNYILNSQWGWEWEYKPIGDE